MKKKVIAIVCAVAVLAAAGGGVTWHFLGNSTKEDDNVVYVNTVKALTNLGTGNGMENRYAGVVESENTWKVEKNSEKTVKKVYVEVGQEVQVGTPLFSYDTEKFQSDLEQAQLDLERINNELSSMNTNIDQLYKDKKQASKDQQASITLEIQEAELDLKKKEYEGKSKQAEIDKLNDNITNATGIVYGKCIEESRQYQFCTYKIYWCYHHRFFRACLFLAGWICMDDELYLRFSGGCHVRHGSYDSYGRFSDCIFPPERGDPRLCGAS